MKMYKHKPTDIIGKTNGKDYFLHFERVHNGISVQESISLELIENSNDWEELKLIITSDEVLPTSYFKTEEIETWIGESLGSEKHIEELNGGRAKLIVLHQCGENKEELIDQLNTLIDGLKNGFDWFATN
jgi:thymidylate synthase